MKELDINLSQNLRARLLNYSIPIIVISAMGSDDDVYWRRTSGLEVPCVRLYDLCLFRTTELLSQSYWGEVYTEINGDLRISYSALDGNNPFRELPSKILDDLVRVGLHTGRCVGKDLYHILTSGRVECFELNYVPMDIAEIVLAISYLGMSNEILGSCSQNLKVLKLGQHVSSSTHSRTITPKIVQSFLGLCPNLEHFETHIQMDCMALRYCDKLKVIKLKFIPTSPWCQIFDEHMDEWPLKSLTSVELFEDHKHPADHKEIAALLKNCPKLFDISVDISRALEHLHSEELSMGTLSAVYPMKKCVFGTCFISSGHVTLNAVHIATHTCPNITELSVLADSHDAVDALKYFDNLAVLLIQWDNPHGGDFTLGLQTFLSGTKSRLKGLTLLNFYNVNFAHIATFCPKLEELKVEYLSDIVAGDYPPPSQCFGNLKKLTMEHFNFDCQEDTYVNVLAHCTLLDYLKIGFAIHLTDKSVKQILKSNPLLKLKVLHIIGSSIEEVALESLIRSSTALEYINICSFNIEPCIIAGIVHRVNPNVIVNVSGLRAS